MTADNLIQGAIDVLGQLGLPRAQQNERSALTLLALLNVVPGKAWRDAAPSLLRIRDVLDVCRHHYKRAYAENTRETFRRQSMHQLVESGVALANPDDPSRAVNSPNNRYQISPEALQAIRTFETKRWATERDAFLARKPALAKRNASEREQRMVPVAFPAGRRIKLSPGAHSELIRAIVEDFAPRFVPGAVAVYVGDTGDKWGFYDAALLADLGVSVDAHGKMPDVVLYDKRRGWLILAEAVTSHGPVDPKRHRELARLFADARAGRVYVTAFPTRQAMGRYLPEIAWETEVWCAESPSHLIHFNGERFLGPHDGR